MCDLQYTGSTFRSLLDRKHSVLGSTAPWSIVELCLTEDEISNLSRWLEQASPRALREARKSWSARLDPSNSYTNDVVCGLILHALYAEHVRRDGTEGGYWNSVGRMPWPAGTRCLMFAGNGQPSPFQKQILEKTAQTFRLRNAFGIEGQQWFTTGYLQFGFTKKGFMSRLPEWLASDYHATNAISLLVTNPGLRSASFCHDWDTLRSFRYGNLSEKVVRERLNQSPWVLADWIEDLLRASRKRPHLGVVTPTHEEDDFDSRFLSYPQLGFDSDGTPYFRTHLEGLAEMSLDAHKYNLSINGENFAKLIRQDDGGYACSTDGEFRFPWKTQLLSAHLKDTTDGSITASQMLVCWEAEQGVQAFKENGARYSDPHRLRNQMKAPIWLLFPVSLDLNGAHVLTDWSDGRWRFVLIDPNQPATLEFKGQCFWSLEEALANNPPPEGFGDLVRVRCEHANPWIKTVTLEVFPLQAGKIRWIRKNLDVLDCPEDGGIVEVPIEHGDFERGLLMHIGLSVGGRTYRQRIRISIPFTGVLWFLHGKHSWGTRKVVGSREVAAARLKIQPQNPGEDGVHEHALLEGHHLVRRVPNKPFVPGPTVGLGSPLLVRRGPFNDGDLPLEVAEAVVDGGLIHQVRIGSDEITILPADGLTFRDDLVWVVWVHSLTGGRRLERIYPVQHELDNGRKTWVAAHSIGHESINSVAAFLEGLRVGSWWNLERWTHVLNHIEEEEDALAANRIIRVLRCPILHGSSIKWMPPYFRKFTASALVEWLRSPVEIALPDGTTLCDPHEPSMEWKRAVGEFWEQAKVQPDLQTVSEVIEALYPHFKTEDPEAAFLQAVFDLTSVSPLLAVDFSLIWLRKYAINVYGKSKAIELLQALVARLNPDADQIFDFCEHVVRADRHFVDHQINEFATKWPHLPKTTKLNLSLLFSHDVARRMATRARLTQLTNSQNVK